MSQTDSHLLSQSLSASSPCQSSQAFIQDQALQCGTIRHQSESSSPIHDMHETWSKGRCRLGHSLKQIGNSIRFVLNSHGELTICDLSNIIYELVCQTELGRSVDMGYKLNLKELQKLRRIYLSYCSQSSLIRNLRRRLYDVLNVMISASIVKRHRGKVRLTQQSFIDPTGSLSPIDRERFELLKMQAHVKLNKLKEKRQKLQQTARDLLMVRKLIDRNEALEMKEDEMVIFPLLVVSCNSTHTSAFSETTVNIRSGETFGVWTEMNLIEQICPVSTQELRKLQKSQ